MGHTHIHLSAASEGTPAGAPNGVETATDKNAKTSRKNMWRSASGINRQETEDAMTMRATSAPNIHGSKRNLSPEQREELLRALKARFEKNMNRHQDLEWDRVQAKLEADADKLGSLNEMQRTGGEPDIVGLDRKTGEYIFYDCSAESPKGRRSV
jgi:hypothetical protein